MSIARPATALVRGVLVSAILGAGLAQAQTITGFTPHGGRSVPVTVTGTGFAGPATVSFGGVAGSATVDSATQISAISPASFPTGKLQIGAATSRFNFIDRSGTVSLVGPVAGSALPRGAAIFSVMPGVSNDGSWGHGSGQEFQFKGMQLQDHTWLYWGPSAGGVRFSMDGNDHSGLEVMGFSAGESDLATGRVVFRGETQFALAAPWPPGNQVCTRLTLQMRAYNGSPVVPVMTAAAAGLPSGTGPVAAIPPGHSFAANLLFEAAYKSSGCTAWQPALDLYDAAPTTGSHAWSSFIGGFWYENTAPEIAPIADAVVPIGGSTGAVPFALYDAETGADAVTLTASSDNQPLLPDANLVFGGSGGTRSISATALAGQSGVATVTVTATDSAGAARSETFTVTTNDPPTISDIADQLVQINQATGALAFTVGDTETDAAALQVTATSSNQVLAPDENLVLDGSGAARTLTVTPFTSQVGTATITVTVTDAGGATASDAFTLRVNAPPSLQMNVDASVAQGGTVVLGAANLKGSDPEGQVITYRVNPDSSGAMPAYGHVRLDGVVLAAGDSFSQADVDAGLVSYVHGDGCQTQDVMTFNIVDNEGGFAPMPPLPSQFRFDFNITLRNDAPTASDSSLSVGLGATDSGTVTGVDADCLADDVLSYAITTPPAKGTLSGFDPASGAYTYTATAGQSGADSFQFSVSDGTHSAIGTVSVSIENQAPTLSGTAVTTLEDATVAGNVEATDADLPAQSLTYSIVDAAGKGTATITDAATGAFSYVPDAGRIGSDSFTVRASDGSADSNVATVTVDIRARLDSGDIVTVAAETSPGAVVAVNAVGDQAIIAQHAMLEDLRGVAADADGDVYVMQGTPARVLHVNAATGEINVLAPLLGFPVGIDFDDAGRLLVALGPNGVAVLNPATGLQIQAWGGGQIDFATDVEMHPDGFIYVTSAGAFASADNRVVRIDPVTGTQSVIATSGMVFPVSLAVSAQGELLVGDGLPQVDPGMPSRLLVIDPQTGTVVEHNDPAFTGLTGLDVSSAGHVFAANNGSDEILAVSPAGGAPSIVSADGAIRQPFGLAVVRRSDSATSIDAVAPAVSYVGQEVQITFSVDGDAPTGLVSITSTLGDVLTGCIDIPAAAGACTVAQGAFATAGTHQLIAHFAGDTRNGASDSATAAHTVVQPIVLYRDDGIANKGVHGKALIPVGSFASLGAALAAAQAGDEVVLGADTYFESGLQIAVDDLTVRGFSDAESDADPYTREPVSIVDGDNAAFPLVTINAGVTGTVLRDLGLRDVNNSCVHAVLSNHGSVFDSLELDDCRADLTPNLNGGGVYMNGPVDDVTFIDNEVSASAQRALVIWNGLKSDITFQHNYVHDMAGCCGLELQDGRATQVLVADNRIERTGDSAIGLVGLFGPAGSNVIRNNTLLDNGRFGIEIKIPDGDVPASTVVHDNLVTLSPGYVASAGAGQRDLAGIAVFRRSIADALNANIPRGVTVRNNTVRNYRQNIGEPASTSDGFGIVLEGEQVEAYGNTLGGNDVGVQRQAGHTPYSAHVVGANPGSGGENQGSFDGEQEDRLDDYFGRGNSPYTCAIANRVGQDNIDEGTNAVMYRDVGAAGGAGDVRNGAAFFCTLQRAHDDRLTVDGNTLQVRENAVLDGTTVLTKQVLVDGAGSGATRPRLTRTAGAPGQALITVQAPNVSITDLVFDVDLDYAGTAIAARPGGGLPNNLAIERNLIRAIDGNLGNAELTGFGQRHAISINGRNFPQFAPSAFAGIVVRNNVIEGNGLAGTQARFFASGLEFDDGGATPFVSGPSSTATPVLLVEGNTFLAASQDANIRYNNGRVLVQGNTFHGAGLEVGEAQGLFEVRNNIFAPQLPLPLILRSLGIKSVQHGNGYVHVEGNTFTGHAIGVAVQNSQSWHLVDNDFVPPAAPTDFVHLWVSTKAFGGVPGATARIEADVRRNDFAGPGAGPRGTAVLLADHDNRARPAPGPVQFGGASAGSPEANAFGAGFQWYFRLDPATCTTTNPPNCSFGSVGAPVSNYASTSTAPFPADVIALDNTFAGALPGEMGPAAVADLQARTYHDEPLAPETPAAPSALGRVEYGLADASIETITTVVSTAPNASNLGQPVTVTVDVDTALGGTPVGSVTVQDVGTPANTCSFAYPAQTSCVLPGFIVPGTRSVQACFSDGISASSCGTRPHFVRHPAGTVLDVVPVAIATPADNDYTRINEAVQAANDGVTVRLAGVFDWVEPFAAASWAAGSDGIAGNGDDYAIEPPKGLANVVITADAPTGPATPEDPRDDVYAATIQGPGDLPGANLEGVFSLYGGTFRGWRFSNIDFAGFDLPIGMFHSSGGTHDGFQGVAVTGNRFRLPADGVADANQNIGLHFAFGFGQQIAGNGFVVDASGESPGNAASTVVMQSNTSGNALYDGLRIADNVVLLVGTQGAQPTRVIGLWENDNAYGGTDVRIERNVLRNLALAAGGAGPANTNAYQAIRFTSFSGAGKTFAIAGNVIEGFDSGITTLRAPSYTFAPPAGVGAVQITGNTILDAGTAAIWLSSSNGNTAAAIAFNRLVGNGAGVRNDGVAPHLANANVTAENNWWGCNGGPGAGAPGCAQAANPAVNVTVTDWLRLHLRSDGLATAGNDEAFDAVLSVAATPVTPGIGAFPATEIDFDASRGSVTPAVLPVGGIAPNTLTDTGAAEGGVMLAASYDDQVVEQLVRVNPAGCAEGAPCTFTIPSTTQTSSTPDALDNDYTRIDNAVQAMQFAGDVVQLRGDFYWTTTAARASWMRGTDDVANTNDDWSMRLRPGLHGGTLRAHADGATVLGDQGDAAGDFTVFAAAFDGANQGWTFQDLVLSGFDVGLGLFWSGSDDFDGTTFANNTVFVPGDDADDGANYGIYTGFGDSQVLDGNTIELDLDGTGALSRMVGIQIGDSCNVACFDGLQVTGNTIDVSGIPATPATPPRVLGLWENAGDGNSAILIEGNTFAGSGTAFGAVQDNEQTGFVLTTQSNAANGKFAVVRGNTIAGAALGLTTQNRFGYFTAAPDALVIEGNALLDNGDGIRITAGLAAAGHPSRATLRFNRIAGNVQGVVIEDTSILLPAGDPTYGGPELASEVNADDNWFGCNGGPGSVGCDSLVVMGNIGVADVTLDTWLTMDFVADRAVAPIGGSVGLLAHLDRNSDGVDVSAQSRFPASAVSYALVGGNHALLAAAQAETGTTPATRGRSRNTLSGIVGTQGVSATLDGQVLQLTIAVEDVLLAADLPAAAAQGVATRDFPVVLSNGSAAAFDNLALGFAISFIGDDASTVLLPADLLLEYQSGASWIPVSLADANGDGVLEGSFPIGTLPAATDIERRVRATFGRDGVFAFDAVVFDTTDSTPYAEDGGDVAVAGPDDVRVALVSGSPQTAPVGAVYAMPVTVRVADESGRALSGVTVAFADGSSAADVSYAATSVATDDDGEASSGAVTANTVAGAVVGAQAAVDALVCSTGPCFVPLDFTNTATAAASVALAQVGASDLVTVVDTAFAGQFCATVRDAAANPVAGVSVAFVAPNTGATADFAAATVITTAAGEACTTASANTRAGAYDIVAQVAGATGSNPLSLVNLPGAAASVTLDASPLSAQVTSGTYTLAADVLDAFGNAVADGTLVTFDSPASGAGVTPVDATDTTVGGIAMRLVNANATTGAFAVSACVAGPLCSAPVTLTNTLDTAAIAIALSGDTVGAVTVGGPQVYSFAQATTTNAGPAPSENVVAHLRIARVGGAVPADVAIDYRAVTNETGSCVPAAPGFWCPLPVSDVGNDGVLDARFGPAAGFPLVSGATSYFRTAWKAGGRWTVSVTLDGVVSGDTYASDEATVDVAELRLDQTPPAAAGTVGAPINTASALANVGNAGLDNGDFPAPHPGAAAPNAVNVLGRYVITGSAPLAAGDVLVEYYAPTQCPAQADGWCDIPTEDALAGDAMLEGGFGPPSTGFPVPAGYDATTLFRTTFLATGTYTVATQLVGVDGNGAQTGTIYASALQSVSIGTGVAATLERVAGDNQSAVVAQAFGTALQVRVLDAGGNPVPNAAVSFSADIAVGGASSTSGVDLSDAGGLATFTPTANVVAGAYSLRASLANGQYVDFALANTPDTAPAQVVLGALSGDGQTAQVLTGYALPLRVQARDRFGNVLAGREILFEAPLSGPSLGFDANLGAASITVFTGADGIAASGALTANAVAGNVGLSASVSSAQCVVAGVSVCTVGFDLRNVEAAAASLELTVLDDGLVDEASTPATLDTAAVVATADAYALRAVVRDSNGNPVPGVSVTFVSPDSGSSTTETAVAVSTDALGRAEHVFDANTIAGSFAVAAFVSGAGSDAVTLTNLADAPSSIALTANPLQAVAGSGSYTLTAAVDDAYGNAVADGYDVLFDAPESGASLAPADAGDATQNGVAIRLANANGTAGSFMVTACIDALCSAPVTLTNTVDVDDIALVLAGDTVSSVVTAGGPLYAYFAASVANEGAAPVENVLADFTVARSGGALPADLALQYRAATDEDGAGTRCLADAGEFWCNLPLSDADNDGVLAAEFGPPVTGFPLIDGAVSDFRVQHARGGRYTVQARLRGVTSGNVYAEGAASIDVAHVALANTPASIAGEVGVPVPSSATLRNTGTAALDAGTFPVPHAAAAAPNAVNVQARYTITGPAALDPADVLIEYHNPAECPAQAGGWCNIATQDADPGDALLEGRFGPAGGFPLPAGYDATTLFRATFLVPGTYTLSTQIVGIDAGGAATGVVYASALQTASIGTGSAASLVLVDGDGQAPVVDTAFADPLVVRVLDVGGNPVSGVAVAFNAVPGVGGASAGGGSVLSAGDGLASFTPTANTVRGAYTLRASLSSGAFVEFQAENRPGAPAALAYVAGSGQTVGVNAAFAPLQVRVLDGFGNAVADDAAAPVNFTAPASGASAAVTSPVASGAGGLASSPATANATAGSYVVTAAFNGSEVDFALANSASAINITNLRWSTSGTLVTVYTGTGREAVFDTTPSTDITCSTTYNGSATLPVVAGAYLVQVACEDTAGGAFGSTSATLTIAKADSGITLTGATVTYDGAPKPATVTNPDGAAFTLLYAGTDATSYGPTSTPPTNAGSYLATLTVDDPNFEEPAPLTAAVLIEPASVAFTFGNLAHVYDGSAKAAGVETTPAGVAGVSLSYAPDAIPVNAGDYVVTASLSNPNYLPTGGNTATLTIAKATAQVTLSDLTRLYDGTPRSVTVTTVPAQLAAAATVTYDGSPTAPTAVGSYAVVATVNDVNYNGSATGTLTILAAAVAGFEADGATDFTGIAGAPLAGALPTVRVTDAGGNGVPSVTVQFDVDGGGGSSGGQATTDGDGYATVPSWTLGADAGINTLTARITGLSGLPSIGFTATGEESTDLSIDVDSAQVQAEAGTTVTYTIVVSNAGPSNAAAVAVSDLLDASFASATWSCTAAGGAACGATADVEGSGDVALEARIPAGGSLTVVLVATLATDAPIGPLANVATVASLSGTDPDGSDDSDAYTIDVLPQGGLAEDIFDDGFEDE